MVVVTGKDLRLFSLFTDSSRNQEVHELLCLFSPENFQPDLEKYFEDSGGATRTEGEGRSN